ncbi:hypothetical protein ACFQZ8_05025 [Micromonospora azadirachtae]|uniref:Uncharacterized protein n=1 Tax=Micromonospora azadirachtae TaxID=1970735 RepID=A0ABW2ZXT0_9ACTN
MDAAIVEPRPATVAGDAALTAQGRLEEAIQFGRNMLAGLRDLAEC